MNLTRREFVSMVSGALASGAVGAELPFLAASERAGYTVPLVGDTHFDGPLFETYHAHYAEPDPNEDKWHRQEIARDIDMWRERCPSLLKSSAAQLDGSEPFVLHLGDLVQGDCYDAESHVRMLADATDLLKGHYRSLPFVTVVGNHDIRTGAAAAYKSYMTARLTRELGTTVADTTFSFRHGNDAFVVVDCNSPNLDAILGLIEAASGARHLFLLTHGPFVAPDAASYRWGLFLAKGKEQKHAALQTALAKRKAIVLCGHTHKVDFKRVKTADGEFTQFTANSVWAPSELADPVPFHTKVSEYGTNARASLSGDALAAYDAYMDEQRAMLTDYWFAKACGHFRLRVTDSIVAVAFYRFDARRPCKCWQLNTVVGG